jgi:catechol 2,3-dioxygenase-like lactoylglutathione lyase family enzyme
MELRSIDHVQVAGPPGCEPAARAFYGGLLGLREIPKPPELAARGGVWFALGPQSLHVGVEQDFRPALKAHPAFSCEDADALAASLEAAGAPVSWNGGVPGIRRFYTADPFGNRLEIVGVPLSSAF